MVVSQNRTLRCPAATRCWDLNTPSCTCGRLPWTWGNARCVHIPHEHAAVVRWRIHVQLSSSMKQAHSISRSCSYRWHSGEMCCARACALRQQLNQWPCASDTQEKVDACKADTALSFLPLTISRSAEVSLRTPAGEVVLCLESSASLSRDSSAFQTRIDWLLTLLSPGRWSLNFFLIHTLSLTHTRTRTSHSRSDVFLSPLRAVSSSLPLVPSPTRRGRKERRSCRGDDDDGEGDEELSTRHWLIAPLSIWSLVSISVKCVCGQINEIWMSNIY